MTDNEITIHLTVYVNRRCKRVTLIERMRGAAYSSRWVIDTREKALRDGLKALGWSPPKPLTASK